MEVYILQKILPNDKTEPVGVFTSACNTKREIIKAYNEVIKQFEDEEYDLTVELSIDALNRLKKEISDLDVKSLKVGETLQTVYFKITKLMLRP